MKAIGKNVAIAAIGVVLAAGCASVDDLKRVEGRVSGLEQKAGEMQARLVELDRQLQMMSGAQAQLGEALRANSAELAQTRDRLFQQLAALEGKKADRSDLERLDREKFAVRDIERLGLDEIRRRLTAVEYEMRTQREELLSSASTGYRNAVKSARECVVELESAITRIVGGREEECSIFIRDFRTLDDRVTVLGDLLSREFTAFMKARSGLERSLYREEYVIGLYQQKKLQVPAKEAFNLENLEKGGFPTRAVLVISGRLTPTAQAYRLDVEVTDLKDPQFRASAFRLIPKDADVNQMFEQVLRAP